MIHLPQSKFHFLHPIHFFIPHTEKTSIFVMHTLRSFALALVGIYLPIYIYQLPHKYLFLPDVLTNNLVWVIIYFFIFSSSVVWATIYLSDSIFTKLNFKMSILISEIVLALNIGLWLFAGFLPWLLIPAALLGGISTLLYWLPYHIFFTRKTSDEFGHYGASVGTRAIYEKLATALAPFFGGLVIYKFGFNILFILSIVLLIISVYPLFVSIL